MIEILKEIITTYADVDPEQITEDTDLRNDLSLNSLVLMNMIVELEDHFDIEIPESDAVDFDTVGDVISYLENVID
ncbi:MAG: acyl carrier protein [Oscillospiraceae bacterium]|nr:acyl carrier protein [Oscillospiraceae bacterium]